MKRITTNSVLFLALSILLTGVSTVTAQKPQDQGKPPDAIARSNGYPSGPHFNLNIHGKDPSTFSCDDMVPGGKSVFINEYGDSRIEYVTNRKSSVTELIALEPCAGCFNDPPDDSAAKVLLPYEEGGFYVFARVRAKPNNGQSAGDPSSVRLYPNVLIEACNDDLLNPDPNFGDYTSCDEALMALGLVTYRDVYDATPEEFVRFDPGTTKGKGKAKAIDITRLFKWSGWVCNESLDTNLNGEMDIEDVPSDQDGDMDIDGDDLTIFLNTECDRYDDEWILNIADLVVSGQDINNDGVKLLKVRFYPEATTWFEPVE